MNSEVIRSHFERIGARLRIEVIERNISWNPRLRGSDYSLDIEEAGRGERFLLTIWNDALRKYEFNTVNVQPDIRHLLLMSRGLETGGKRKFLCGHDERHWFVAGVPEVRGVRDVQGAMEALKPTAARAAQVRNGVKQNNWHRRNNQGFIRQGEWFFIPEEWFEPEREEMILRNEPLRRGGGKPHMVSEVYRTGGTTVYVSLRYRNGLTETEYKKLIARRPEEKRANWTIMRRNPRVYARGKVRHKDHKTIELPCWHRVLMNDEWLDQTIAFLD